MKKLLSFLVSVCLVCALIVPAHAAGSVNFHISASSSTVSRGDEITFTVTVSGSGAVKSYGLVLSFDTSVFEMVGGSCTVSGAEIAKFTSDKGFVVAYTDPTTPSGTVGSFTLRVKDTDALGSYSVSGSASAKNGADSVSSSASGTSVTIVCSHSYGNWTKVDGDTHSRTCTACGESQSASHNWDGGKTTKPADCQTTGELLRTCPDCGATKTETIPLGEHKYSSWSRVDDSKHTHTCSVCSKEETVNHSWNGGTTVKAANCITDGEMRYTCTGCGATRTQTVSKTGVHTYDHGCDKDCNVCGATRTTTHDFSDDWVSDKNGHWHECTNCGEKSDAAAHIPGPEPTDTTDQVCTACAYIIKPSLNHEHVYADKLTGDESGHWFPCAQCDDQKDFAPHDFDNDCDEICDTCQFRRTIEHKWSEAWESDAASHYRACTVCGEKQDTAAHDWRRGVCTVCQAADPNYEPFTLPFWAWLIIGFALGCGFTSLLFLLGRKRSKDERNDDPPSGGKPAKEAPVKTDKPAKPAKPAKADKPVKPAEPVPVAPARKAKAEPAAASAVTVEEISAESLMAEFSSSKSTPVKTEPAKAQPAKPKAAPVMPNPLKAKPVVADPDSTEAMFKEEPVKAQPAKAEPAKPKAAPVTPNPMKPKAAPVMPNPLKARPVVADPDSTEAMFKAESSDRAESLFKAAPLMSTPGKTKPAAPVTPKPKSAPSAPIATAPEASGAADPDADISSEVQILSNWKPF